jgi:hypothetical protein
MDAISNLIKDKRKSFVREAQTNESNGISLPQKD